MVSPPTSVRAPRIDPAQFTTHVTNRYFPLVPGLTYVYEGTRDGKAERTDITVTHDTKRVASGVACLVIHEVTSLDGQKVKDVFEYYAQATDGAVWSFGRRPGVVMPGTPRPGEAFRLGKVIETGATVSVPLSTYKDAVVTREVLAPGQVEHKTYAPGVGFVQGERVKGGREHLALVSVAGA